MLLHTIQLQDLSKLMSGLIYKNSDECASFIIDRLGNEITIATPVGLGKPIQLPN